MARLILTFNNKVLSNHQINRIFLIFSAGEISDAIKFLKVIMPSSITWLCRPTMPRFEQRARH